jgi:hypothetical protein
MTEADNQTLLDGASLSMAVPDDAGRVRVLADKFVSHRGLDAYLHANAIFSARVVGFTRCATPEAIR